MALQLAFHSVAEQLGIPYVYAAWCPITLPSQHHASFPLPSWAQLPLDGTADNRTLWTQDAKRWNDRWAVAINCHRAASLGQVSDVRTHILTARPWLAADPTLAPWPETADRYSQASARIPMIPEGLNHSKQALKGVGLPS